MKRQGKRLHSRKTNHLTGSENCYFYLPASRFDFVDVSRKIETRVSVLKTGRYYKFKEKLGQLNIIATRRFLKLFQKKRESKLEYKLR